MQGKQAEFLQTINEEALDEFNCQQARVICQYGGKEYTYPLTLETRPIVDNVCVFNKQKVTNGKYMFDMTIRQRGAKSGFVTVSDDAGSVYTCELKLKDDNLHIGPLVDGGKAYVNISLENDYGYTVKYLEIDKTQELKMYKDKPRQLDMAVWVNGKKANNTFHDGDSVSLSLLLNDTDLKIDSVVWKAILSNVRGGKENIVLSKDFSLSFRVRPRMFGCTFTKAASAQFGFSSKYDDDLTLRLNPDSCRFVCTAYAHKYGDMECQSVVSGNYTFDVLPECPVLKEVKTWTEPGDEEWPITMLRIATKRYDYISIYVILGSQNRLDSFQDTVFAKDYGLNYIIEPRGWDNTIYCTAWNTYGTYMSAPIKISKPTHIADNRNDKKDKVSLQGNHVRIECDTPSLINIYDKNGGHHFCSKETHNAEVTLSPGFYIVRIENKKKDILLTKKIRIR